jgi:hypothetical protein
LARQSLGDKSREIEILGRFDHQAGLAGRRLGAADDPAGDADVARMLGASARIAGAFAVAAACDAYAATLLAGVAERDRARALEILHEEIVIARGAISDLLAR